MKPPFKLLLLLVWGVAVLSLLAFAPFDWGRGLTDLRAFVSGFGVRGEWVFALLTAMLMAIGSPRLVFFVVAGVLYGFWAGMASALAGSLLGSWLMFRVVRWGGRRWARQRFGELRLLRGLMRRRPDVLGVIMARQLPLSNVMINAGLALSRVSSGTFIAGTLLGFLPQGMVACLLGSGAERGVTEGGLAGWPQLAAGGVLACALAVWAYRRRRMRSRATAFDAGGGTA